VRHVLVAGQPVVIDHRSTRVDHDEVMSDAHRIVEGS
jgi:hypothetical protein